jgi:hypothetical protein
MAAIIAFLANLEKILSSSYKLIRLFYKNKIIGLILIIALILLACSSYWLVNLSNSNDLYAQQVKFDKYTNYTDNILLKCGDKTGISVSVVDTVKLLNDEFTMGRFEIARACDARSLRTKCIINLKDVHPSTYSRNHQIDRSSYAFLVKAGKKILPIHFNTRNERGEQDFSLMSFYPGLLKIVKELEWYKQGLIHDIWITSILDRNEDVLYVITLLSAKSHRETSCINKDSIIIGLRDFINNRIK